MWRANLYHLHDIHWNEFLFFKVNFDEVYLYKYAFLENFLLQKTNRAVLFDYHIDTVSV